VQALEPEFEALGSAMQGSHVRVAKYQADTDREFASSQLGLKTFPSIVYYPKVCGSVEEVQSVYAPGYTGAAAAAAVQLWFKLKLLTLAAFGYKDAPVHAYMDGQH
jgi:hypothetical protein